MVLFVLLLAIGQSAWAQDNIPEPDDAFLLYFGIILLSLMAGIALIGVGLSVAILFLIAVMTGAGILSISIYAGMIRKSGAAGVKTALYLVCALLGAIAGSTTCWIVTHVFHLSIQPNIAFFTGMGCGIIGGVLWAYLFIRICRKCSTYLKGVLLK